MSTQLNPYINFNGNAREAFEFYQSVLGGKLEMHTFGDFHTSEDPTEQDNIMHAMLTLDNGEALQGADTPHIMEYKEPCGFSVSLNGSDAETLRSQFEKLADGGTVHVQIEKQVWGDEFGMVTDKYGINWLVNIHAI